MPLVLEYSTKYSNDQAAQRGLSFYAESLMLWMRVTGDLGVHRSTTAIWL